MTPENHEIELVDSIIRCVTKKIINASDVQKHQLLMRVIRYRPTQQPSKVIHHLLRTCVHYLCDVVTDTPFIKIISFCLRKFIKKNSKLSGNGKKTTAIVRVNHRGKWVIRALAKTTDEGLKESPYWILESCSTRATSVFEVFCYEIYYCFIGVKTMNTIQVLKALTDIFDCTRAQTNL